MALGALALCTARRWPGAASGAGAAGTAVAGAAASEVATTAGSGIAPAAGSGTFALWWAQATLAISAREQIRMDGAPFLIRRRSPSHGRSLQSHFRLGDRVRRVRRAASLWDMRASSAPHLTFRPKVRSHTRHRDG